MRTTPLAILTLCAATFAPMDAAAQNATATYKFDFGVALGASGYIGEANGKLFRHPGFTADIAARYIYDTRWAFRASLSTLGLSGNTADIDNVLPGKQQFDFSSQVYDLSVRGEFNFFSYGIGETYKRLRRITPYLAIGLGLSVASSDGETVIAPSVPMAFGVKYKLKERINLIAEFSMTKVLSDKVDGKNLADINHIKINYFKNTDWFSRFTVGISYEFGKRCETCHYVD